ncbi:MAG: PHP domain-containing protein [Solirubrobacterales bacterium]
MPLHRIAAFAARVQRSLGLPECATPPEEVYELAKRLGMDFVTITDHDTIDGCLQLADRPDCFVSEELTARFSGEPQAVHESGIACALAHPLQRRRAADAATPRSPRRALPDLRGAQTGRAQRS